MGSLIIPEQELRDIISQMPPIDYGDNEKGNPIGERNIQFGWGNKKELNKYLAKKQKASYPLTWLLSPSPELHIDNSSKVERDCSLIIATLDTRKDLYNPDRYKLYFDRVLNPIAELFVQGIRSASTTRFLNDDNVTITKFPDYSEDASTIQTGAIELWDAIRIDCRIEFNNSCLNNIKWITS